MSTVGRNDPCPCGSGRKFKQCCLRSADVVDLAARRMRESEGRLIPRLIELAVSTLGQAGIDEAYGRFFADTPAPDDPLDHPDHESVFLTWLPLTFARARGKKVGRKSAAQVLLESATDLSEFDRRFAETASRSAPSFYVVLDVVPGRRIDLEDILTGTRSTVVERSASTTVQRGGVLYARVVTLDDVSIMLGCGATQLPPIRRADLADLREVLSARGRPLTKEDICELDDVLRRWYLLAAEQERHPRPPKLVNTDGDPITPTTLHFALQCPPGEAFTSLRSLHATEDDDAVLLVEAERDPHGQLRAFSLDWTKAGNRMHADWDNTILGHLEVKGEALTATVNSKRRATRLQRQVEKRLGQRVTLLRTVIESVDALLADARSRNVDTETDGLQALNAQLQQRQWDQWIDQPVPALNGQTRARPPARHRGGSGSRHCSRISNGGATSR